MAIEPTVDLSVMPQKRKIIFTTPHESSQSVHWPCSLHPNLSCSVCERHQTVVSRSVGTVSTPPGPTPAISYCKNCHKHVITTTDRHGVDAPLSHDLRLNLIIRPQDVILSCHNNDRTRATKHCCPTPLSDSRTKISVGGWRW